MIKLEIEIPENKKQLIQTFLYLICCALNDAVPEQKLVENTDLESLYYLAKKHSLLVVLCMALEQTQVFQNCDQEIFKKWFDGKNNGIRKNMLMDAERKAICAYMEQAGIWYMPLKGILLQNYYPKFGMRQMADQDILYDAACQKQLMMYMKSRGYQAESVGLSNHDVYKKKPVFNFEMHTALYGESHKEGWETYYRDVKQRLVQDTGSNYGYHFQEEDFYIYILSHAYKHFSGSGTGLRTLTDLYVYLQKMENHLDRRKIDQELKKLELVEFEQEIRSLCKKVFGLEKNVLTQKENQILAYYIGSGTYGTIENYVSHQLTNLQPDSGTVKSTVKFKYLWHRLFPDADYLEKSVPAMKGYRWLYPVFSVYRVIRGCMKSGKRIKSEIRAVKKVQK